VIALDQQRWALVINVTVKAALILSFVVAIGFEPSTVEGKAMGFRAPLFLAPAVLVPIVARARRWNPYPHTADALLSAPFLVDTFGTAHIDPSDIEAAVRSTFDLRPGAIVRDLGLKQPIYRQTAAYGHFGRDIFPWEQLDKLAELKAAFGA